MDHRPAGGAGRPEPQARAYVLEQAQLVLVAPGPGEPGLAGVEEDGGSYANQAEDVELEIEAVLQREQVAPVPFLVAQGVAAQAAVPAEEQLVLSVQVVGQVGLNQQVETVLRVRRDEIAQAAADQDVFGPLAPPPPGAVQVGEQDLRSARDEAGAHPRIQDRLVPVEMHSGAPSPREQILNNIISILELLGKNRALLSILLEGAVGLDKGFAEKLGEFYEQIAHSIESSLQRGQKMGLVRKCDTRIAALAVVGALKEVLHDMLRSPEEKVDRDALAAEILDIFRRGVVVNGISIS